MAKAKDPHELVWWKDQNGNYQQMRRHAVVDAELPWTEVPPPPDGAEEEPAEQASTGKKE